MFDKNYNSETFIKKTAYFMSVISKIFLAIDVLAAFIVFVIDVEDLWWIALIILGSGLLAFGFTILIAHILFGFGDIVGNTRRIAECYSDNAPAKKKRTFTEADIADLPEI